ncbi:MAG: tetratricopeptide repeat protein [Gemmatimonadetes bacterium]|nr:tetratricopeptide repeat protein [Gemmatimonadota bacterium]
MGEHTFSVREAAALLDLTPTQVRSFARAGLDHPEIAGMDEARFGFRDLVVLRMAAGLKRAHVPSRRISGALARLRATDDVEVAGLRLEALGAHVVVRDGSVVWRADSGQFQLDLAGPPTRVVLEEKTGRSGADDSRDASTSGGGDAVAPGEAAALLARAASLEATDPEAAIDAYRRATTSDPGRWEAHVGLGFLLQQEGHLGEAIESYRRALEIEPDPTVSFNLGVALDDAGRIAEAEAAYAHALELDPELGDAHFNLSCLYEKKGDRPRALRHMIAYRERAATE